MNGKKMRPIILYLILSVFLCSCGSPKGAGSLISQAKSKHGPCTVVSKTKDSNGGWDVVLKDDLQGFEYRVSSYMRTDTLDGAEMGSFPGESDTFRYSLMEYVGNQHSKDLNNICMLYNATYELFGDTLVISASTEQEGINAACECAAVLQQENLKNRLDGVCVVAVNNSISEWIYNEEYARIRLPNTSPIDPNQEVIDYYTDFARSHYDMTATYLRTEQGTFGQTGADFNRIANVEGPEITGPDSPVTLYYFQGFGGKEFYVCNFTVYDDEMVHYQWYSNY